MAEERFRVVVEDNGPGIVRAQIPRIFGKLLYGSKFHRLKQSRGQQGIGISAAGMYGQLTTGKPVCIISRTAPKADAHRFEVKIDTQKNEPIIAVDEVVDWDAPHGTRVEIELEAVHKRGRRSVDDYLAQTAIANPHVELHYREPGGEEIHYPRVTDALPHEAQAIKPHPHGVELGMLMSMLEATKSRTLHAFLQDEFCRVRAKVADEICERAMLRPQAKPASLGRDQAEQLLQGIAGTKIMAPPTNCLSPIGDVELEAGLRKVVEADFFTAVSRKPAVYRGNPFLIEAALACGGPACPPTSWPSCTASPTACRCCTSRAPARSPRASSARAGRTTGSARARARCRRGPLVVIVHIASVWVPFTSESKEAIADYPEILHEIRLALQECGRRLGSHIRRGKRLAEARQKSDYIESYIPHIGEALREILDLSESRERLIVERLSDTLERSRKV